MNRTSWVEICVSDFEQSITWFEQVLGFRVMARDANDYAELSRGETFIQLAADHAPYWESERPSLLPPRQRGSGIESVLLSKVYPRLSRPTPTLCVPSLTIPGICANSGCAIPMDISFVPLNGCSP